MKKYRKEVGIVFDIRSELQPVHLTDPDDNTMKTATLLFRSVSDPLHYDAGPDPDLRIRFRDNGPGSDLRSNKCHFF